MVSPTNIVNGNIVANTTSLQQPGFGVPLVLGNSSSAIAKGSFRIYTNMIGVSADFTDSDPEWIAANAIFSQNPTVQQIFIGRELDRVAQISTIVFSGNLGVGVEQQQTIVFSGDLITANTYHLTVNGGTPLAVAFNTNNADTLDDICTAIALEPGVLSATNNGSHTITITADTVGESIALTSSSVSGGVSQATTVITQTVAPVDADTISGFINDTEIDETAVTSNAATLTAIAAAISGSGNQANAVSDGTHTITVTSSNPGVPFVLSSWAVITPGSPITVTLATGTANVGFSQSLTSIANVNNNFYGVIWTERSKPDVEYAFDVIEGSQWFFQTATTDVACYDSGSTTDLMYFCKAGNYNRSAVYYSATANTQFIDAATMGANLPFPPGGRNWAFTQLNGVTADNLTQTQYAAILAKNGNLFVPFANVDLTYQGKCGGGLFIDYRIGIDWTNASMVTALFNVIAQLLTGNKVPYSDQGVSELTGAMLGVLEQGAQNNFIYPGLYSKTNPFGFMVTSVPVSDISTADVAIRYYPSLAFTATFLGAIDSCTYNGTISLP